MYDSSGLELLVGDLPWKYIMKGDDVKKAKLELVCFWKVTARTLTKYVYFVIIQQSGDPQTSFLALTCDSFQEFARAVLSLNTDEQPNYAALQALLTVRLMDPVDFI